MRYNWKRFWCPREGRLDLSDGGYLRDPDSDEYHIYNPDVVPFGSISEVACLILLGEPGIGKTSAMNAERIDIEKKIDEDCNQTLWFDLRSYGSEDRLIRELFEDEKFDSWKQGDFRLYIFLDSLDECLLRIDNLAAILVNKLKTYPVERLNLRIACRTANWPNILEEGFKDVWGTDAVKVYELAPLRRKDVVEAAKASSINSSAFLSEIDRNNAVPFAIKPITLEFLINKYKKDGQIPNDQTELYFEGCLKLCEEINESRPRSARKLSAQQRLVIASRIAAITIFSNKYALWTGIDRGNVPDEDVRISRLSGGNESVGADRFDVTEKALEETLDAGLFSSRGPNRMGWAHQTYAEFLAAHYIKMHNMPLPQVISLITHPGDPDGKLVPQLHGTSAWLATMRFDDVFQHIMNVDPYVLLRSDLGSVGDVYKENIVDILLTLYDEEKLPYPYWLDIDLYKKLIHPKLADQIRAYISDNEKSVVSRKVAIRIARACNRLALQDDLVKIALDPSEPLNIREEAAHAISDFGEEWAKKSLKPLAISEGTDDPNDQLKGYALMSLWPDHITAEELFFILTPPKRENFLGIYEIFLNRIVEHISPQDLPAALKWVERKGTLSDPISSFAYLSDHIMQKALMKSDYPNVLNALAKVVISRLKHYGKITSSYHDPKLRETLTEDDNRRRRILNAIVPLLPNLGENNTYLLFHSDVPIASSRDLYWMIECLRSKSKYDKIMFYSSKSLESPIFENFSDFWDDAILQKSELKLIQHYWADLIDYAFDRRDTEQLNSILLACEENKILAEKFVWLIEPIELASPRAKKMKERYFETQELLTKRNNQPLLDPPPSESILVLIDEFESGDISAWWRLNRDMTLRPDSTRYGNELESDLTSLPGWDEANVITRSRIIAAAKRYLLDGDPETKGWLGTNILHRPAFAGYRAFQLLLQEDAEYISTIPVSVWEKWAPIIISYPIYNFSENYTTQKELVKKAYHYAPDEIIKTLIILIDKENKNGHIFITDKVEDCWDEKLATNVSNKVKDNSIRPECMGTILKKLLDHNVEDAEIFAKSVLTSFQRSNNNGINNYKFFESSIYQGFSRFLDILIGEYENERLRAIIAASSLMTHPNEVNWMVSWRIIEEDTDFGRDVITKIANDHRFIDLIKNKGSEDQLADLYIWLFKHYPPSEDPIHEGVHLVDARDNIAELRDAIPRYLKESGKPGAVEAIKRMSRELPEQDWLKWTIIEAQNIARSETWTPPKPDYILLLARDQQKRLVENGNQLLDILIESLKQLEMSLQDETPASRDIWDRVEKTPNKKYRPIDEEEFSDYVARYLNENLRDRGVVIGREVRIHRGDRTDIHVDAIKYGPRGDTFDSVAVIIEVKGCWNAGLSESMRTQLLDRYLRDNRCQHGLYLVGWFNCDLWDDNDYRRRIAQKLDLTIDEARPKFEAQAAGLSNQNASIRAFVMNTSIR